MKNFLTTACLFVVTAVAIVSFIAPAVFGQESKTAKVSPSPATAPVMNIQQPRLSPDGSQIVFRVLERLWIQSLKGGQARRLAEGEGTESYPTFSPDGRQIAFVRRVDSKRVIHILEIQSGKTRTVASTECGYEQLDWSLRGDLIAATACDHDIVAIDPVALTVRVLAKTSGWEPYPQLSENGKTLYFHAEFPGTKPALYQLRLELNEKPEPIMPALMDELETKINGQWMARPGPDGKGVHLSTLNGANAEPSSARVFFEPDGREFSFTPDGSALIYVAGSKLWSLPLEGGESTEIPIRLDYAGLIAEINRKRQAVVTWLKDNAIPVKTVEAGNGFQDLQPLKKVFKDVRFVGLGEATHGTREFFQFKHRMLEFLVKEMGFRVFAIEASYPACQNINDYVMGKTDDGAKALDSLGQFVWNTEEIRAMIDWMRTYNRSVSPNKRVKFVGFDLSYTETTGQERLLEYLKRVAPERVAEFEESLKANLNQLFFYDLTIPDKQKETTAKLTDLQIEYNRLFVFLEINGVRLAAKSNQAEFEQMLEYARVVVQTLDFDAHNPLNRTSLFISRDPYMADNFRRLVEREPAGTRFVIWAHNAHVTTGDKNYFPFGQQLRRFYDSDYYALGLGFNQGSFQAAEIQPGRMRTTSPTIRSFTVNPAPAESIDWYLAQTGVKSFVVDFRSSRKNAETTEWLAAPNRQRLIGSSYGPDVNWFSPTTIAKEFDGLFFIDTTTRARPNPSVKNVAPTP